MSICTYCYTDECPGNCPDGQKYFMRDLILFSVDAVHNELIQEAYQSVIRTRRRAHKEPEVYAAAWARLNELNGKYTRDLLAMLSPEKALEYDIPIATDEMAQAQLEAARIAKAARNAEQAITAEGETA